MKKQDNLSRTRRKKVHALAKSGRFDKAISLCEKLCTHDGSDLEAWSLLGNLYKQVGRQNDVIRCFQHVVDSNPTNAVAVSTLASEYIRQNNVKMAEKYYHQAVLLLPEDAKIHTNYGYVLANMQKHTEAEPHFRKALQLDHTLTLVYSSLASCLRSQGKIADAIDCYEKGLSLADDDIVMHSNYLLALHYLAEQNPAKNLEAHKKWVQRHINKEGEFSVENTKNLESEKVLRIGYVSSDFRTHSVAYFLAPLLSNHNKEKFKIYCYSNVPVHDQTTKLFKNYADVWRDTVKLSDQEMESCIRADEIDILVDLSGHTAGNRLAVFARKPTPIEVTWLGYPDTTGLDVMDYRISDSLVDPAEFDEFYSEKLYKIDGCFVCYQQLFDTPPVALSPFNSNGYITFGSFNNLSKINDTVLKTWADILKQVPDSRLQIKNPSLTDTTVREHFLSIFINSGIEQDRIILKGLSSTTMEHLTEYNNIDIALDTFPYNGTTTTCEALWMGVPVLTVAGNTHANCVGKSLLTASGLSMWVTDTIYEYIKSAVTFANKPELLDQQRMTMRDKMLSSVLCDGKSFAEKMEKAYRYMWHEMCEKTFN
jgi:predicted O-linked N-acetylglucosamine transferase (SPINDLY family)